MEKFRIVSFDGGGLKGLISLAILRRICDELSDHTWINKASMFAGTSTGGLIALGLADGKSIEEIISFYEDYGPDIFNRNTLTYISSLGRTIHIGYENGPLNNALEKMFGNKKLVELDKKVLVASFDLSEKLNKRKSWAPKIFHNFTCDNVDDYLIRDVALFTSAAPTYLPSVNGFIDGGVCANNPSVCALAQALDKRTKEVQDLKSIQILSIGTGINPESIGKKTIRWGILGWNIKVLKIIMDGSVGIADYQCKQILSDDRYKRIQLDLNENIDMDDQKKINEMIRIGTNIDKKYLDECIRWIKDNW